MDIIKFKNFYASKHTINKMEVPHRKRENFYKFYVDIGVYYAEYIKNSYNSTIKR